MEKQLMKRRGKWQQVDCSGRRSQGGCSSTLHTCYSIFSRKLCEEIEMRSGCCGVSVCASLGAEIPAIASCLWTCWGGCSSYFSFPLHIRGRGNFLTSHQRRQEKEQSAKEKGKIIIITRCNLRGQQSGLSLMAHYPPPPPPPTPKSWWRVSC